MAFKNVNSISYYLIFFFVFVAFAGIFLFALKKVDITTFVLINTSVALGILAQKLSIAKRKSNI